VLSVGEHNGLLVYTLSSEDKRNLFLHNPISTQIRLDGHKNLINLDHANFINSFTTFRVIVLSISLLFKTYLKFCIKAA